MRPWPTLPNDRKSIGIRMRALYRVDDGGEASCGCIHPTATTTRAAPASASARGDEHARTQISTGQTNLGAHWIHQNGTGKKKRASVRVSSIMSFILEIQILVPLLSPFLEVVQAISVAFFYYSFFTHPFKSISTTQSERILLIEWVWVGYSYFSADYNCHNNVGSKI